MGNNSSAESSEDAKRQISEATMETVSVFQRKWESCLREDMLSEFMGDGPTEEDDPYTPRLIFKKNTTYVLKQGWMYKRGDVNPTWKLRYFKAEITSSGEAQVQYSAKAEDTTPLGYICCAGYEALAFDPKDNSELLGQTNGEPPVVFGIKMVPTNPHNVDSRFWWLKVDSAAEQIEWVEALRMLCRLFIDSEAATTSAAEAQTSILQTMRRNSMSIFTRSSESEYATRRSVTLAANVHSEKENRRLRRVFASTFVQTRQYFSIQALMLPCMRYGVGGEVQLLEETMEPVLRQHIFDRMADKQVESVVSCGTPRTPRALGLIDEFTWCRENEVPPLPLYLPSRPHSLTDSQYLAAESIVRPAAVTLWNNMKSITTERVAALKAGVALSELTSRRDILLKNLKLSGEVAKSSALVCAAGGEPPTPESDTPSALDSVCSFLLTMAPTNTLLLDASFHGLSQACLSSVTAMHRELDHGVGTAADPGELTLALLADLQTRDVASIRRHSESSSVGAGWRDPSVSDSSGTSIAVVSQTQAWLRSLMRRTTTVVQPTPGTEGDVGKHSIIWEAQRSVWEFYVTTMASSDPVPMVLEANFLLGTGHAFDLLYGVNMERIRAVGTSCAHSFEKRVMSEMLKLKNEGMLSSTSGGFVADMSRRRVVCKVLSVARMATGISLVSEFEALLRSLLVNLLSSQVEHELLKTLVPTLRKKAADVDVDYAKDVTSQKLSLWSAESVGEHAGRQVVNNAMVALVNSRMKAGEVSVVDHFVALSKRIAMDRVDTVLEETSILSSDNGEYMNQMQMTDSDRRSDCGGGRNWDRESTSGSEASDQEDLDDNEFNYARASQMVHLEAAQALRTELQDAREN